VNVAGTRVQFPNVTGSNLQRKGFRLPQDFQGDPNLVLIAFQQWQQRLVDSWITFARQLEEGHPGLRYYELPAIQDRNIVARTFINEGMRAGIPDPVARERTITLYLDTAAFRAALHLPSEDDIYVLLVDRHGRVVWRTKGAFSEQAGTSMVAFIRGSQPNPDPEGA
jgi:hypothetical protein